MKSLILRLQVYAVIFSAFVAIDAFRSMIFDKPGIISWHSAIHSGWVVFSSILLLAAAFLKFKIIKYFGLILYFAIFLLTLVNQSLTFSETLNYYCMLFNFSLFTIYYFATTTTNDLRSKSGVCR